MTGFGLARRGGVVVFPDQVGVDWWAGPVSWRLAGRRTGWAGTVDWRLLAGWRARRLTGRATGWRARSVDWRLAGGLTRWTTGRSAEETTWLRTV
ncbi:hypothetical protein [Nocardia sp. CA-135398]|uniref:hypothetical protein n=1 Tax=Nocardia sp. CA-135398 TaxID=3239977 RepID=UPI003D97328D